MAKIGNKAQQNTHYNVVYDKAYCPATTPQRTNELPPGIYTILYDDRMGYFLYPKEVNFETILELPGMPTKHIMKNLETFWKPETKQKYLSMGLAYKRGVLIHGLPGTGKTMCVVKVCEEFIKKGGVVIFNPKAPALHEILTKVRDIQPDLKILVVWEEFDEMRDDSELLSLLDGELQTDNIVYLATTNFIDKIPDRIKNRPSRFAEKIEVGFPTLEDRKTYLASKMTSWTPTDIQVVADATEKMVIDQLKDIVISIAVFDLTLEEAIAKVKTYNLFDETDDSDEYSEEEDLQDKIDSLREEIEERNRNFKLSKLFPKR